jgi:hypothetical protein
MGSITGVSLTDRHEPSNYGVLECTLHVSMNFRALRPKMNVYPKLIYGRLGITLWNMYSIPRVELTARHSSF